jgi:hypothetical protein
MSYAGILLFWILSMLPQTGPFVPQGAWRQSGVEWNKPPAEIQIQELYAETALLYFGPNHEFSVVYATVIQGPKSEGVSHGDGRVVYLGKWKSDRAKLRVEFRLVSRTVRKGGEIIPGPVEQTEISMQDGALLFRKMSFTRDKELDSDLLAIFQGESARQDAQHQPQETPEAIAKAMFPNAPGNKQDINCFRSLTVKMSVNDVVEKCGRPDEELGSGLYIFVWHMADGSVVSIGTPYLEKIGPVRLTDASDKTTVLPGKK